MRTRANQRAIRLAVVLATLTALLSTPLGALALKGSEVDTFTVAIQNTKVSEGQTISFRSFIANNGNATLTNVKLESSLKGADVVATFAGGDSRCTETPDGASCSLGNIASGAPTIAVDITFRMPSLGETATRIIELDHNATFTSDARRNNGASSDRFIADYVEPLTFGTGPDYRAFWQPGGSGLDVTAGAEGDQTARVRAGAAAGGYGLLVAQVAAGDSCGVPGVGKEIDLSVANGQLPVSVTITYSAAAIGGRSPNQMNFFHDCEPLTKGCSRAGTDCFDASWSGGGPNKKVVVTILLSHNGLIKGW